MDKKDLLEFKKVKVLKKGDPIQGQNMKFDYTQQPGLIHWNRELVSDDKPLISIITAFYNAGKYFRQTYQCVIDQTFPWFEWIIIDDGSTDEKSLTLLNDLVLTDSRIKIIHQKNSGAPAARNTGIANATTDYIFSFRQ